MARDILLGVVIGAQGLSGEVRVKTFTATPGGIADYGPLRTKDGRSIQIESVRVLKPDLAVLCLKGVNDRTAAEALKSVELYVGRQALALPDDEQFYHADLVGLRAQDDEGRLIGEIRAIHNFGAGDVIEIVRSDGGNLFLPFTRETVPTIDLAGERVVVAVPKDEEALVERGIE